MRTRLLALALIVAAAGLSGCLGGDDGSSGDDGLKAQAEVDESTGAIQGVVTDAAVQPLEGATVTLVETGDTARTASDGSFAVSGVLPGTYTVKAAAESFVPSQQEVTVRQGEVSTADFKLAHQTGLEPYQQQFELNGFVECSVRAGLGVAVCAVPNSFVGNTTNDRFLLPFQLQPNPYQMVTEVEWEANQPLGTRLSASVEPQGLPNDNKTEFGGGVGDSPLRIVTDRQRFLEVDTNTTAVCEEEKDPESTISANRDAYCNRNYVEEGGGAWIRIFVAHAAEPVTVPEPVPCVEGICFGGAQMGAGATFQQEYHAIVTIFYHAPACQSFSVLQDAPCPQEAEPRSQPGQGNTTGNNTGNGSGQPTSAAAPGLGVGLEALSNLLDW